jgi:hypothetical protein
MACLDAHLYEIEYSSVNVPLMLLILHTFFGIAVNLVNIFCTRSTYTGDTKFAGGNMSRRSVEPSLGIRPRFLPSVLLF